MECGFLCLCGFVFMGSPIYYYRLGAVFFYALFAAAVEEEADAASFSAIRAAR